MEARKIANGACKKSIQLKNNDQVIVATSVQSWPNHYKKLTSVVGNVKSPKFQGTTNRRGQTYLFLQTAN